MYKRQHINCGHPPNADLERVVRLSGGSEAARIAVRGLTCTICRKAQKSKLPRPGRLRENIGQFNDVLLGDVGTVKDADGMPHDYLVLVDEGTDFTVVKYLESHEAGHLYQALEEAWIGWAGPPDVFVADGERGFSSESFAMNMGQALSLIHI